MIESGVDAGRGAALGRGGGIGILGGGQLGRMLSIAAARLGLKTHIYEPGANPPAGDVAAAVTTAAYADTEALARLAAGVALVTFARANAPAPGRMFRGPSLVPACRAW